jgi:hypothetical protein
VSEEQLIAEGFSPAAADSFTNCYQKEVARLIDNVPAEQFNQSEAELYQLGENLGMAAANSCLTRIAG